MVTEAAVPASAGTSVTAVAPLPITTTRWPVTSRSSRPVLRVHDPAAEPVDAREGRRVALVVAVVARAHEQEAAGQRALARPWSGPPRVTVQRASGARPLGVHDARPEADPRVHAVLTGGVADVVEDRRAVGDGRGTGPGPEGVAQGVHVGVGADAGIAEQVPGAADRVAGLQDGVRLAGQLLLQVDSGADAGQAGPDDDHVEVLQGCGGHGPRVAHAAVVPSARAAACGPCHSLWRQHPREACAGAKVSAGPAQGRGRRGS